MSVKFTCRVCGKDLTQAVDFFGYVESENAHYTTHLMQLKDKQQRFIEYVAVFAQDMDLRNRANVLLAEDEKLNEFVLAKEE